MCTQEITWTMITKRIFIVSSWCAQGVQLAKQIEDLDGKIRDSNNETRTKKEAVSRTLSNCVSLEDYLVLQPVENIENKIQQKSTELTNLQRTQEKATEIQSKGFILKDRVARIPIRFSANSSQATGGHHCRCRIPGSTTNCRVQYGVSW